MTLRRLLCLFGRHKPSPWREYIFEEVWLNCQHCKHSWREDDEGDYFAVSEGRSMTRPRIDWKYYAIYYAAGIGIPFAMIVLLGMALGFIFAEGAVVP